MNTDKKQVIYDIERCICHVPDACRDCSRYGHGDVMGCMEELLHDALILLNEQPEIVRCKDCKWWDRYEDSNWGYCHACKHCHSSNHWSIRIYREYPDNWFCADGERK